LARMGDEGEDGTRSMTFGKKKTKINTGVRQMVRDKKNAWRGILSSLSDGRGREEKGKAGFEGRASKKAVTKERCLHVSQEGGESRKVAISGEGGGGRERRLKGSTRRGGKNGNTTLDKKRKADQIILTYHRIINGAELANPSHSGYRTDPVQAPP